MISVCYEPSPTSLAFFIAPEPGPGHPSGRSVLELVHLLSSLNGAVAIGSPPGGRVSSNRLCHQPKKKKRKESKGKENGLFRRGFGKPTTNPTKSYPFASRPRMCFFTTRYIGLVGTGPDACVVRVGMRRARVLLSSTRIRSFFTARAKASRRSACVGKAVASCMPDARAMRRGCAARCEACHAGHHHHHHYGIPGGLGGGRGRG